MAIQTEKSVPEEIARVSSEAAKDGVQRLEVMGGKVSRCLNGRTPLSESLGACALHHVFVCSRVPSID